MLESCGCIVNYLTTQPSQLHAKICKKTKTKEKPQFLKIRRYKVKIKKSKEKFKGNKSWERKEQKNMLGIIEGEH